MSCEHAIKSIENHTLYFSSASCYSEDDTKVDDLASFNHKRFDKTICESFIEMVRKQPNMSEEKVSKVSRNLSDFEQYYETLRKFTRVCCCTDSPNSSYHWEKYACGGTGACLCFKSEDIHREVRKISYEPRTDVDPTQQLSKLLHLNYAGTKLIDKKIPTKQEVLRYTCTLKGQLIERLFSRSAIFKGEAIHLDKEWRYITFGKVSELDTQGKEQFFDKLWGQFQAVYLGPNVSEADKSKVIEVCEKYSIPIFYEQTTQL